MTAGDSGTAQHPSAFYQLVTQGAPNVLAWPDTFDHFGGLPN